jgi:hypothetical protein
MSPDPTSPTRTPTLFAEDSRASPTHKLDSKKEKPTPDTSGQKCLDLSGSVGPLGLLEKTLLESPNWAWTKYSLTWKTKATPQGRLIFQLARLAHRTSAKGSGLLHTPTAKGKPKGPSMLKHKGNWATWATPKHDGSFTSPTLRGMLNQSKEPKGSKKIRKSKGAGSPSRNVADPSISGLQEHGYGQAEDAIERSKDVADPQSKRHGRGE